MNLAHLEILAYALLLGRAFYCLRIPLTRSTSRTSKGESYGVPREIPISREV